MPTLVTVGTNIPVGVHKLAWVSDSKSFSMELYGILKLTVQSLFPHPTCHAAKLEVERGMKLH